MKESNEKKVEEARRLLEWGNREAAYRRLSQAIIEEPQEAELWYWLAQTVENPGHAVESLKRAVTLDPSLEMARAQLAELDPSFPLPPIPVAPPPPPAPAADLTAPGSLLDELGATVDIEAMATDSGFGSDSADSLIAEWQRQHEAPDGEAPPEAPPRSLLDELDSGLHEAVPVTPFTSPPDSLGVLDELEAASAPTPSAPSEAELWQRTDALLERVGFVRPTRPVAPPPPAVEEEAEIPWIELQPRSEVAKTAPFPLATQPGAPFPPKPTPRPMPSFRPLVRLLSVLLPLGLLAACGWLFWQNPVRFLPAALVERQPAVATTVVRLKLQSGPAATPLPVESWVTQADEARRLNQFTQAETLLSEGLALHPNDTGTLVAMAQLLTDLPGREGEAWQRANEALVAAKGLEERARAAEALAWAALKQTRPDSGIVQATGEQAAALTPSSPHAQWARAVGAALYNEPENAREAAALAMHLDGRTDGTREANEGALLAWLGDGEGAIARYQAALTRNATYAPWHAALVTLLREAGRTDEIQPHLDALRRAMPTHPLLRDAP